MGVWQKPEGIAPATGKIAAFIAGFSPADLPANVREASATLVLDGSGALRAAANPAYSTGRLISEFVASQGGYPQASVVGQKKMTSVANAALANGTMGYACDIEPHHPEGILHPIAVMLPTALAIGEFVVTTGPRFLAAVALGCEIEYRVSMALGPSEQYRLGFHPSAVCGCFGATAAAAWLLGLDQEATIRALGLAACQASGLMAWESDPTENARPFQMGMAARNGVTAALLARSGFGGPRAIFDEGHTVFRAFSRSPNPAALSERLGESWDGVRELAIKPYSCVSFLHPGLDALLEIVRSEDLRPDDIASLTMRFPTSGVHCVDGNPLKSHCAQYILSVAVANRQLRVADIFVDQRAVDQVIAALCQRVTVVADDELDALFPNYYATIIEVVTRDGRKVTRRNDVARGYPETALSEYEIEEKFRVLAGSVAPPEQVEALREAIAALPRSDSLRTYAGLMREPAVIALEV